MRINSDSATCSPTDYFAAVGVPTSSQWVLAVGATMEADLKELNGLGPAAWYGSSARFCYQHRFYPSF